MSLGSSSRSEVLNNQVRDENSRTTNIRRKSEQVLWQQNVDTASISGVLQSVDLTIDMASDEISHEGVSQERRMPEPFDQQPSYTRRQDRWSALANRLNNDFVVVYVEVPGSVATIASQRTNRRCNERHFVSMGTT